MMKRFLVGMALLSLLAASALAKTSSPEVETRGVWFDKSDIILGKEAMLKAFDELSAANLNTICLPVQYRGYVVYPDSAYLPQDPKVAEIDKDYLSWLVTAAHDRGLFVEAWPEYGYYAYHTKDAALDPSKGAILDKYPQLTAIDSKGQTYVHNTAWGDYYSLCPANPQSHAIMKEIYLEIASRYQFDALNLDRIRYPTPEYCFCEYCKEHFKADTGLELTPAILKSDVARKQFDRWRMDQLNKFMKDLSAEIHSTYPEMMISADVWDTAENEGRGQDWGTWLKEDYLDIAIPMLYARDIRKTLSKCLDNSPDSRRVLVGISVEENSSWVVLQQIRATRKLNCGGVVFWNYNKLGDDLKYLKKKVFQNPVPPYLPVRLNKVTGCGASCSMGPNGMVCQPNP